ELVAPAAPGARLNQHRQPLFENRMSRIDYGELEIGHSLDGVTEASLVDEEATIQHDEIRKRSSRDEEAMRAEGKVVD
ncbi:hypothetical protein PENTCL1PPCAC_9865, partial [Pristionchus entomophagus]